MRRKPSLDTFGIVSLTGFALLLAFNQVVIKVTNGGLQPVFFAGLRSLGAAVVVYGWLRFRGIPLSFPKAALAAGILTGIMFAA